MASNVAYALDHVSFSYSRGKHAESEEVLKELSCLILSGRVLGILGPNGSGKSTLLKLLARVLRPLTGTIDILGESLSSLSQLDVAKRVALVPQETLQVFPFTIAEMVLMGRSPHHQGWGGWHWEDAQDLAVAQTAMEELDVAHLGNRLVTEVSGGERQRAVIARALVQEPQILLLDEPTAFLDLHHQLDIARIIKRLNRERGLTVVLVSHDLNLASQYCDQVLMLNHGRLAAMGSPQTVMKPDVIETVYGCSVLVDRHPQSGRPRVSLPL
ncbi:MAG: ABC transporter ATP-binding protein [Nitrospirota bacterium]|nr:ABC transporter ATP-binding protein [Nitrospirota bacterium]MDH5586732.1 ABC transporter ATP-binding protein [Nitrospirota bacterium]MDH5775575.1 ABC transporter ATP-binding protein [Nitrospirota bacterium]